jgi:hypothetical protein
MSSPPIPPPGTRLAEERDRLIPFEPEGSLRDRVTLGEIIDHHLPSHGQFALLRVFEEQIVAAASFTVQTDDLFVAYLTRSALFRSQAPVAGGRVLVEAIFAFARQAGKSAVRLDSVSDLQSRAWYEDLGFLPDGPPREEPGWGFLHPLVRRL